MKTAILAGSTGLIGAQVLELLLKDDAYSRIVALSRRPLGLVHPKLTNLVVDMATLEKYSAQLNGDDIFCCLGTTIEQAGSKEEFRKVDFEYPLSLANITRGHGAKKFLLVTALGANKHSRIFYNRVKGEVEEAIAKAGFETFHIFQPSMLLGRRLQQRRGERIAQSVMKYLGFLIPRNYKAIESANVGRAMVAIAGQHVKGTSIHESAELQSY